MLGAWRLAPCSTLRLVDNNNNNNNSGLVSFAKCRLMNFSRSSFFCSSSTSTSSFSVADEEEKKLEEPMMPSVPPNLPSEGKPTGERKGKRGKVPSGIQVPRQKHIAVSKSELLEALVNTVFASQQQSADQLLLISSCLDSILHAEHRRILEEMRADYSLGYSVKRKEGKEPEEERGNFSDVEHGLIDNMDSTFTENFPEGSNESEQMKFPFHLDLRHFFGSHTDTSSRNANEDSSVYSMDSTTRFQRSFMNLLHDAQFEELSARDLMLTSAINTDYLLTLPIYVDWEKASDSNMIIFRRGYATEKEQGMLVVDKLDYLQSRLIQACFGLVSKPLQKVGLWINEALNSSDGKMQEKKWIKRIQIWLNGLSGKSNSLGKRTSEALSDFEQQTDNVLPIWLASQRAVSRYKGFLSAIGPRGMLLRKLLSSIGLLQSAPEMDFDLGDESDAASESYMRPVFLPRVSLNDIWGPATRKYCGSNIWKMLRAGISIIFSESVLQARHNSQAGLIWCHSIHTWIIFCYSENLFTKGTCISGINFTLYREDRSAVLLDVVAVTALIIFVSRVALGYKQTWDRYQLLVNKTLYEKTLASGFGSVYFLLDASEQQQYKECILTYALLLNADNGQVVNNKVLAEACERFLYEQFKEKVEMPVEKALNKLMKLGLVRELVVNGKTVLQVVPSSVAYSSLRKHWDSLLS